MLVLHPTSRVFVSVYVRPGELDHVLHMVKPTLSLSPFGFFYLDMSVLPHKSFVRSQMQFVLNIKKELPFGSLQLNLYTKNFMSANANAVTTTERLRQQGSFPFRLSKGVDVGYSEGTILASATVFEQKREIRMFQSVPVTNPVGQLRQQALPPATPALFIVSMVFAISYIFSAISRASGRAVKVFIICLIAGCLIVFFLFRY